MKHGGFILLASITLVAVTGSHGAKILGVFPMASHSHFIIGFKMMKELAERGHEVTFINSYPQKNPIQNLRDVPVDGLVDTLTKRKKNLFAMESTSTLGIVALHYNLGSLITEHTFTSKAVQELLNSNSHFDVIIIEEFLTPSLLGLGPHFKAPVVLLCTVGAQTWNNELFGNPSPPSYIPNALSPYSNQMSLLQRIHNLYIDSLDLVYRHWYFYPEEDRILHKYLPKSPPLDEVLYNASLILLNSHSSFKDAVPLLPGMIEIGGFHVNPPKSLPADLQQFLDDAKEGVVYFSMGSNLKSDEMPAVKRDAILKAFSNIKQKVLWKFETDGVPGLPANVKIQKWLPQEDILVAEGECVKHFELAVQVADGKFTVLDRHGHFTRFQQQQK